MLMATLSTRRSLLIRLRVAARGSVGVDDGDVDHAAAWEEFVRIYTPEVLRWCRGCGLQETDAADVCQDVLVRFWKQAANFEYDPSRRFRGYLRQILNTALAGWSAARRPDRPAGARCGRPSGRLSIRCVVLSKPPEAFGDPDLDDRLPGDSEPPCLGVERLNHPDGEIDVDSPLQSAGPPGLGQIQVGRDVAAGVKRPVERISLHFPRRSLHTSRSPLRGPGELK